MEEKERYVYHEVSNEVETYECYWDNQECCELFDDKAVLNRLNEQDYELKKLNQENIKLIKENQQLKQQQRIAELEEQLKNAIVPKYKTGDKVYGIIDTLAYTDVLPVEIRDTCLLYEVWY